MVRFLPANLARLVAIALQNPLNQDGAAPAASGVTNIGMSPALSAVPPAVPTGYRSSSHAAVEGDGETPPKVPKSAAKEGKTPSKEETKKGSAKKGKTPPKEETKKVAARKEETSSKKETKKVAVAKGETPSKKKNEKAPLKKEMPKGAAVKGEMPQKKEMPQYQYGVRTAEDERVPPKEALQRLMDGNARFVGGKSEVLKDWDAEKLGALAEYGQAPMASVLGCADSRAPVELLFDALPGDIFVLRNAGNTLTNAEGSMVGSLEFSVNALGVKLVVVLGHTECGAIKGATGMMLNAQKSGGQEPESILDSLLSGLSPVVEQAQEELGGSDSEKDIATKAVEVNVFAGIEKLLDFSESIREKVKSGEVQVHGAVYDISTGKVNFLGEHPQLPSILKK